MKEYPSAQKRTMTLIEVMIVISIIIIATGGIGFSVQKAIVNQQFQTEVSVLVDELRLAQNLMLILGTDIHVKIKADSNKNITYWIETETDLPSSIAKEILRKRHELKTVKAFHHKDAKNGELDLKFFSHGNVMSDGIISLSTTSEASIPKNALQAYICLPGYPKSISSFSNIESAQKQCETIEDQQFDKALTEETIRKTQETPIGPPEIQGKKFKEAGK